MRGVVITGPGGPEVLAIAEVPEPTPGPWDIRVAVLASALNRADILQRRGFYPAPHGAPAAIPGLELAGRVESVGALVTRWKVGDLVMAIVAGGAQADLVVLHEREAMRVPAGLDAVSAAAIPEAFMTAFDAAVLQGGLASGQWLAVNAVGSGVGTAAVQVAKAIGAFVVGSARTASKLERARVLGLDVAVPELGPSYPSGPFTHASVFVDLLGGPAFGKALDVLRPGGTAVLVGLMAGARAEIALATVLQRRLRIIGTVLRSRPLEEKITLARAFEDRIVPLFESRRIVSVIDRVVPLTEVADAHRALEVGDTFGKVVLAHA